MVANELGYLENTMSDIWKTLSDIWKTIWVGQQQVSFCWMGGFRVELILLIFNDNDDCKDWFDGDFALFAIVRLHVVDDNGDRDWG